MKRSQELKKGIRPVFKVGDFSFVVFIGCVVVVFCLFGLGLRNVLFAERQQLTSVNQAPLSPGSISENEHTQKEVVESVLDQEVAISNSLERAELLVSSANISSWKVYRNEELNISFKYPNDWEVLDWRTSLDENGGTVVIGPISARGLHGYDGHYMLLISKKQRPDDLMLVHSQSGNQFDDKKTKLEWYEVNNNKALKRTVSTQEFEDWIFVSYAMEKDGFIYGFSNGALGRELELFDNVVSSVELR